MVEWEKSYQGPLLSLTDVERFEAVLGAPLPHAYRSFLLSRNGGRPVLSRFHYLGRKGARKFADVAQLDPLIGRPSITDMMNCFSGCLPTGSIPIGTSMASFPIVLYVSGPRVGQIWFKVWDDLLDEPNPTNADAAVYFLADSFENFLDKLAPEPSDS